MTLLPRRRTLPAKAFMDSITALFTAVWVISWQEMSNNINALLAFVCCLAHMYSSILKKGLLKPKGSLCGWAFLHHFRSNLHPYTHLKRHITGLVACSVFCLFNFTGQTLMKQGNRDNAVFFIEALSAAVSVLLFLSKTNGKVESHTKSRAFLCQ